MRWTEMVCVVLTRMRSFRRFPGGVGTGRWSPVKKFAGLVTVFALSVSSSLLGHAQEQGTDPVSNAIESAPAVHHDMSPPLREIPHARRPVGPPREIPLRPIRPGGLKPVPSDPVAQHSAGFALATTTGIGFDGIGVPNYTVNSAPPDPNGAPGARMTLSNNQVIDQYVQWVNEDFAVFEKGTGAMLYGPAPGNTLWTGFGGPCETNNDGDPIVQYDKGANRWILTQFAVTGGPSVLSMRRRLHLSGCHGDVQSLRVSI